MRPQKTTYTEVINGERVTKTIYSVHQEDSPWNMEVYDEKGALITTIQWDTRFPNLAQAINALSFSKTQNDQGDWVNVGDTTMTPMSYPAISRHYAVEEVTDEDLAILGIKVV